jgi:hypothetical protein
MVKRSVAANFLATSDGFVNYIIALMIVRPTDDPLGVLSKETRIAHAPEGLNDPSEFEPICPNKRQDFIKNALRSQVEGSAEREPVEQIAPSRTEPIG